MQKKAMVVCSALKQVDRHRDLDARGAGLLPHSRSYARVFGIVLNHRNVENETEKVQAFSEKSGIPIVGEIPRSDEIIRYEDQGMTVIEGDKDSAISKRFFDLAELLLKSEE